MTGWMVFNNLLNIQNNDYVNRIAAGDAGLRKLVITMLITIAASTSATAITLGWVSLVFPNAIHRMGLLPTPAHIWLGFKSALWILPPVLIVSFWVSMLVPYEHVVLDTLRQAQSRELLLIIFVGTAIVAPVCEEFLFRVLLQGGLERLAGRETTFLPNQDKDCEAPLDDQAPIVWKPTYYWPIVVSSLVFALMHAGQGAAPVPLFLMSLGLGYLYRQTGNITASLVVHMVLNSLTLLVEFTRETPPA